MTLCYVQLRIEHARARPDSPFKTKGKSKTAAVVALPNPETKAKRVTPAVNPTSTAPWCWFARFRQVWLLFSG